MSSSFSICHPLRVSQASDSERESAIASGGLRGRVGEGQGRD